MNQFKFSCPHCDSTDVRPAQTTRTRPIMHNGTQPINPGTGGARLSMNRWKCRQVLDCASPLALSTHSKRRRAAAVQDAVAPAQPDLTSPHQLTSEFWRCPLSMSLGPKAVLKPPHSKRCRDGLACRNFAKRLECVRFTGAFGLWTGKRFMVPMDTRFWN
jgi:hypothetical protein